VKRVNLWVFARLIVPAQEIFCPALTAQVGLVQNIFSSSQTISIRLSPSPSKLARSRAGSPIFSCVVSARDTVPLTPPPPPFS
jgi:hypothetical protein